MTVIVGTRCTDGIVIGADSMSTSANGRNPLIQVRSDDKIRIVGGKVIVVGTGSIGLSQRFEGVVQEAWAEGAFDRDCGACLTSLARTAVDDFRNSGVFFAHAGAGYDFGAMVAAPFSDCPELVEFNTFDFQPERKTSRRHFVALGSGQTLADPFLAFISRVLWAEREPTVATATIGVCWALDHAIKYAPGGVGEPIRIAVLRREAGDWQARLLPDQELQEQRQHIDEIEKRIGQYALEGVVNGNTPAPAPPAPPMVPAGTSGAAARGR